jgi:hypothetical protein
LTEQKGWGEETIIETEREERERGLRTFGPVSVGKISISFILAPAPLDETDNDLNTASLAAHRPAKEAVGSGAAVQYLI